MKNLIKTIITSILTAAILITGINIDTTTVTAATTKGGEFTNGGSVTIKPGDSLKLTVTDTNKIFDYSYINDYDVVENYKWSSSDTSVLKVGTDFYDEKVDYTECVVLIGVGPGTATVTGKSGGRQPDITMTVTVSLPKATAKQKKCKHKFKTTKAATCERVGIKTCKKCKFQKMIAKKAHQYVDKKVTKVEYDYTLVTVKCTGHDCTEPHETVSNGYTVFEVCNNPCYWSASVILDKNGNATADSEYASIEEALYAHAEHDITMLQNGYEKHGTNGTYEYPYGEGHTVTTTVQACKWGGTKR